MFSYGYSAQILRNCIIKKTIWVIRLGYLSPYIVEKIAAGDLPHVSLETLMKLQTPLWAEQHKALGID